MFLLSAHAQIQNTVKTLKNTEKHENMWKIATKAMKFCKGYTLGHHMTFHGYYQCNTKRKTEVH